jgi:hypothetical protein
VSRSAGDLGAAARPLTPPGNDAGEGAAAADGFPALGSGADASGQAHPSWVPVRTRAPRPGRGAPDAAAAAAPPRSSDFPPLGGARCAGAPAAAPSLARAPSPAAALASAAERAAAQGGVSEELKAANRALIERIKQQLDAAGFSSFKEQSSAFMRGDLTARRYHDLVVGLGLLPLVAQLAELCPDAARREGLLAAHKAFLQSSRAADAAALGAGWVPPEAGLAAAARAEARVPWACAACTLVNAPSSHACEVCGAPRGAAAAAAAVQQRQRQNQQSPQAPSGRMTAAALVASNPWSSAAAAGGGGGGGGAGSGAGSGSGSGSSSTRPVTPPQAPAPPRPADFPTLGGGS